MNNATYKLGDVANGHVLTENGWIPLASMQPVAAPPKKGHTVRNIVLAVIALIVVGSAISAATGGSDDGTSSTSSDSTGSVATDAEPADDSSTDARVASKASKPKPHYTMGQVQAIGAAKDYLAMTAFSEAGLIEQLSSSAGSGFKHADAVFAVNHIKVNWNEQAARSAKEYLSMTHFSRDGLITQLSSRAGSKFTHAQAVYGVNDAGL